MVKIFQSRIIGITIESSFEDAAFDGVVESFEHARVRLVLERDCDGRRFDIAFNWLVLSPSCSLVEVEGWDVNAVTRAECILVKVIDVSGRWEALKIWVEQIDGRFVDIKLHDHLMTFNFVMVGRCGARHHFLTIYMGHQSNV